MTGPPPSSTLISMQVGVARQSWSDSLLGFFNPWNSTECSISSEDNVLLTLLLKNKTTSDIVGLFFDSFPFYVSSFPPTKKQRNNGREPKEEGRVKRKKKDIERENPGQADGFLVSVLGHRQGTNSTTRNKPSQVWQRRQLKSALQVALARLDAENPVKPGKALVVSQSFGVFVSVSIPQKKKKNTAAPSSMKTQWKRSWDHLIPWNEYFHQLLAQSKLGKEILRNQTL